MIIFAPKRDTLQTLEVSLPVYGRAASLNYAPELWESFKIEVRLATWKSSYAQIALFLPTDLSAGRSRY